MVLTLKYSMVCNIADISLFFDFYISDIVIGLLVGAVLCAAVVAVSYLRRLARVSRTVRMHTALADLVAEQSIATDADAADSEAEIVSEDCGDDSLPMASIVVYSYDEAANLRVLLPQLLGQKYAPGFEVIVVNEGESAQTTDVVDSLRLVHDNLYLTYTPDSARNLSRKKLALTLGIKAAHHPVVVHVTGGTLVPDRYWLHHIMRHYADPTISVVLGYALPVDGDRSFGFRRRAFDNAATAVAWLSSALGGNPYRGTAYNVSYRRQTFFDNKGFSRSLNLRQGDDDIFISEIANGMNTAVELSQQSFTRINCANQPAHHAESLRSHLFTGQFVSRRSRAMMALGGWSLWLMLGLCVAAAVLSLPNLFTAAVGAAILISVFVILSVMWRRTMRALSLRPLLLTVPWLALTLPLRNVWRRMCGIRNRKRNYTWTRNK